MKKLLSFLIITILFNGISTSAQGRRQDPCDAWYSYQDKYISDNLFKAFDELETSTLRNITIEDIDIFFELSDAVKQNYKEMRNGNKINNNDIIEWKNYVDKIHKAIKDEKWPSYPISKKTAEEWKKRCDEFYLEYNRVKSPKSQRSTSTNYNRGASESNYEYMSSQSLREENKELKEGATLAFEVCLFYPLAVKYNKEYVDYAYQAAEKLIQSDISTESPAMRKDWDTYSPLLKNYGKYNNDVINFIKICQRDILKSNGKVSKKDIKYFEDNLAKKLGSYSIFYDKDVTIPYLNNVIDEFFDMLNKSAASKRELSDNAFNNFIRIYLK